MNASHSLAACLLMMLAAHGVAQEPIRTVHESNDRSKAVVTIHADHRSAYSISRYLTGKFCEHLRNNVLNGMDAQILRNPTFADFLFEGAGLAPDGGVKMESNEEKIAQEIREEAAKAGFPEKALASVITARREGLACFWIRLGEAITSPDTGPFGGRAQRIEPKLGRTAGIAQWVYLPLHRIRKYNIEIFARTYHPFYAGVCMGIQASLGDASSKYVANTNLQGDKCEWQRLTGTLEMPADAPADEPYKLTLMTESDLVLQRVLLRPSDHVEGADPDVIRFLKQSKLPILRWPGGNFVSTYHWKDGVGPLERRPTRPNLAWGGAETNYFGTDEFMAFCHAVGCEPMICINTGDGTPQEAAEWIEYCNGPPDSPIGTLRAANGHPRPYNVKHWEVGNELWGKWQLGWTTPTGYVDRYLRFSTAMLAADKSIHLYACGAPQKWDNAWNETLISMVAHDLTCITDHPLIGGDVPFSTEPLDVYRDFMAVPEQLERRWRDLGDQMSLVGVEKPRIALTELQMFAHLDAGSRAGAHIRLTSETLVKPSTMAEAMYDILIYHAAIRLAPLIELITHSATVNHGGGLRKVRERVYANPCHYAQSAFAELAGATPVNVEIRCSREKAPRVLSGLRNLAENASFPSVDAIAAVTADALWLSIVHCGTGECLDLNIEMDGFAGEPSAHVWILSSNAPWDENDLDKPERIKPVESTAIVREGKLRLQMPSYSVARVRIHTKK